MAARGTLLRAVRRPVFQMSQNIGASYSAVSRSRFVEVEEPDEARARLPSFFSCANNQTPLGFSAAFHYRSFSSDADGASSKVVTVKDDGHFQQAIKQAESSGSLGVVYFTAQWCGPCKQIAPYIDELSQMFDDVTFLKVDVDNLKLEETMKESRIGVVPTFQFHKDGKLIGELTGAVREKLTNLIKTLRAKQQ